MAEFNDPLRAIESDFATTHSLEVSAGRIALALRELEKVVHIDGSEHVDDESIWVTTDSDLAPANVFIKTKDAWLTVQTHDRQGDRGEYFVIDPATLRALDSMGVERQRAFTCVQSILDDVLTVISDEGTEVRISDND